MASDYEAIKADNQQRYGTDVGRYGKSLLTDLYDDRTHFIYELLQNAEDALRRRDDEPRSRSVRFDLSEQALRISHYGKPFDRWDVEGVCGIALGTKAEDVTQIGRFGIGFKSVYGFTARPEIHSGNEDFGIDSFVWPSAATPVKRRPDETVILMPLRDPADSAEVRDGLKAIRLDTLLFLRRIDTIEWNVPGGEAGVYVGQQEDLDDQVRKVTVIGKSSSQTEKESTWLVFSTPMHGDAENLAGHVEVAFSTEDSQIVRVPRSPLVVFFPTVVETDLGFRVQGPYRTTPSRDNVPKSDAWNQVCVKKTGEVLVDALLWLRKRDMLDVNVLECLPLDQAKFEDSMFAPLYKCVQEAFRSRKLLPTFSHGYAKAGKVKLARTQELRNLFGSQKLKQLFESDSDLTWLSDRISQDRTPALRTYLMDELDVDEITPQMVLPRLRKRFLDQQSNAWMCRLYEFLKGQPALHRQAKRQPIIRLFDGKHVPAFIDDIPQAFLPGAAKTGFPTVHEDVCQSTDAFQFLNMIGLREPHLVDDVIRNVLPKYDNEDINIPDTEYAADIDRILAASQTNTADKREELLQRLREASFVRAIDATGEQSFAVPREIYGVTERLKSLFSAVSSVKFVDEGCEALRSDDVRQLLESCGAVRYLLPIRSEDWIWNYMDDRFVQLREQRGYTETSGRNDRVSDCKLRGLDDLLEQIPSLDTEDQRKKSKLIWEELVQLPERRGKDVYNATYTWSHYGNYQQGFDSHFVKQLNETAWIPDQNGQLKMPSAVLFGSLGWRDDPFLLSKIRFKPPIVEQLAAEAGFEPALLNTLKERNITSKAEFEKLLPPGGAEEDGASDVNSVEGAVAALGVEVPSNPSVGDPNAIQRDSGHDRGAGAQFGAHRENSGEQSGRRGDHTGGRVRSEANEGVTTSGRTGPFISYIAVDQEGSADDPDGLVREERMKLEKAAIDLILSREPKWQRTPTNNEGFDLVKVADDQPYSWCEVKAMKGSLQDRPVGLSRAQFDCARGKGDNYWLYVVEQAASEGARIVRIQNPAGKARTFSFDKGWLDVATVD